MQRESHAIAKNRMAKGLTSLSASGVNSPIQPSQHPPHSITRSSVALSDEENGFTEWTLECALPWLLVSVWVMWGLMYFWRRTWTTHHALEMSAVMLVGQDDSHHPAPTEGTAEPPFSPSSQGSISVRLDKLLSNLGYGSRSQVQSLIKSGQVTLDGSKALHPTQKIILTADLCSRISIHDQPLDPAPTMVVMMNKPEGYTCSRQEEEGSLVYDLLPARWLARQPPLCTVGRLDKYSSGLLLFTDDGELLHRLSSPKSKHKVAKRYLVTVAKPFTGTEVDQFASGEFLLPGESKPLLPALMQPLSDTTAYVTLYEGRYRQLRRMFATLGNEVTQLHRDQMGSLTLPTDLLPGQYRLLTVDELRVLCQ